MRKRTMFAVLASLVVAVSIMVRAAESKNSKIIPIVKSEDEWKKTLTPEQFKICRQKGTEPAFANAYWNNHEPGKYLCAACGLELFGSKEKYDSGTGWPSFWKPVDETHIKEVTDTSYGMKRVEVVCARCGSHLGHVFEDGPKPTGLRYCMNSAALKFEKK